MIITLDTGDKPPPKAKREIPDIITSALRLNKVRNKETDDNYSESVSREVDNEDDTVGDNIQSRKT